MTILTYLTSHYGRLECRREVPSFGFTRERIAFSLVLSTDGEPVACDDLRLSTDGRNRGGGQSMAVPRSFTRSGIKPRPFFLWDNSHFVLGLGNSPEGTEPSAHPARAGAFRDWHERLLDGTEDPGLLAVLRFLRSWTASRFRRAPFSPALLDRSLVFRLLDDVDAAGRPRFLHDRPAAQAAWEPHAIEGDRPKAVCLVTGQVAPVARLHPAIKGVWGAPTTGASLVSFHQPAFRSHGKVQGDNAPVSEAAAFQYGAALNALLAPGSRSKLRIGDITMVFWADAAVHGEAAARRIEALVGSVLAPTGPPDLARNGGCPDFRRSWEWLDKSAGAQAAALGIEPRVRVFILGLTPNGPRLSVRFWQEVMAGALIDRLTAHWHDLRIEPPAWKIPPSPAALLYAMARQGRSGSAPQQLAGDLMRAILTGDRYPLTLLVAVLQRLRAGEPVDGPRAALCKAILQRAAHRHRRGSANQHTDPAMEVPVSLDRTEFDQAYRLGRLFAVLENVQRAALGRLNASVRDRYYGAASATPANVFPLLLRTTSHHLKVLHRERVTRGLAVWFK
ncbi:type I-C CRISPR-associated protein Cas8c/Csd1 [Azospirillum melinis]|uniref:type I-C CRISPR-associated protein Cas8c/Csd1 n=1 Tax=Azospirillum melinis TaxID=328839 RepID=UPI0037565428